MPKQFVKGETVYYFDYRRIDECIVVAPHEHMCGMYHLHFSNGMTLLTNDHAIFSTIGEVRELVEKHIKELTQQLEML